LRVVNELANLEYSHRLFEVVIFVSGRYLESWYYCHWIGEGRAAQFRPTSDEGAIFNSEKRPTSAGGKLQQVVSGVCRQVSEQRTGKRKNHV